MKRLDVETIGESVTALSIQDASNIWIGATVLAIVLAWAIAREM